MPKVVLVKRGKEYLSSIQLSELEETYRRERPGKSGDRLQAAVLRKLGRTLEKITRIMERGVSTVHRWLSRMEREGLDGRHDGKSPGRPRLLNPDQEKAIEGDLDGPPSDSGFMRGSWNAGMLAGRTGDGFGVIPCSRRAALRIADRLGFSTCEPWSVPCNGATPEGQAAFIEETRGITTGWNGVGRTLPAVNAAALLDSPASDRGLRRRGGKEHRPHQPFQKV